MVKHDLEYVVSSHNILRRYFLKNTRKVLFWAELCEAFEIVVLFLEIIQKSIRHFIRHSNGDRDSIPQGTDQTDYSICRGGSCETYVCC